MFLIGLNSHFIFLVNTGYLPGNCSSMIISELDLGQNYFIGWFTNPPTVIFQKVEKYILFFIFILSTDFNFFFVLLKNVIYF